ncbi:MAG: hypothetical protein JWM41_2381 [Gemmatimonadetes bacterium]|nr:hypothetical protein [Gemmatimonadota bacterium]
MGIAAALTTALIGRPTELPADLLERYPELARATWRRGGLPVRVGGWCLGRASVSAITLWHTIWLAPNVSPSDELLLHELRHVDQFEASALFPLAYLWQSLRHGYVRNRFEVDARQYAARRVREP